MAAKNPKIKEDLKKVIEKIGTEFDPENLDQYVDDVLKVFDEDPNMDEVKKGLGLKKEEDKK
ncbi:hypothetical protein P7H74_02575 [Enterococcus devriesei]|uniref:hypothetical protein n=1 Tax=Enterococcus TaxID=1350 RepID=UPI0008B9D5C2|nr:MULTISPECIES: hypothetical protein [Enterococcus]MDT2820627.1 hypothetical protein [Enterococcus devriesei]SET33975.1 hypothetical protein SAMN04487821_11048 [Enterococcus malodoratus]